MDCHLSEDTCAHPSLDIFRLASLCFASFPGCFSTDSQALSAAQWPESTSAEEEMVEPAPSSSEHNRGSPGGPCKASQKQNRLELGTANATSPDLFSELGPWTSSHVKMASEHTQRSIHCGQMSLEMIRMNVWHPYLIHLHQTSQRGLFHLDHKSSG